jgi:AraC-like DNA-binding protein
MTLIRTIHLNSGMARKIKYYRNDILNVAKRVKKLIDDDPTNRISTAELASEAGISRNILQIVFKNRYGAPIGRYRLRMRMSHAKFLLSAGKSVKEIAITLHYSSISSFNNTFRNFYGQSPSEWRARRK